MVDYGDLPVRRWRPDRKNLFAQHWEAVVTCVQETVIRDRAIATPNLANVAESPTECAEAILPQWATEFERLLIHFDVDVVDFNDLPLAENYSKNKGLSYDQTLELLEVLLKSPKFAGLTVTEINPDYGAEDGSTIPRFAQDLSRLLALVPR